MSDPYAAFEISRVRSFNPDTGPSFVLTFAGTAAEINTIAAYYELLGQGAPIGYGYKTKTIVTSAGILLTVEIPDTILYTTRWEFDTELVPESIWWSRDVRSFLGFGGTDLTTFIGLREWLQEVAKLQLIVNQVQHAQARLTQSTFDTLNDSPAKASIVYAIVRDGDYFEVERPILKRCRTVPVGLFDVRTRLSGRPQLYSLDGIYNLFGLTNDVYDQAVTVYDDLPAADPHTVWAWKMRQNASESVTGSGKVQENRNWVFGRWSTITNTFIE